MLDFLGSGDYEFLFDRTNIKAIVSDMLIAAIDTTPTAVVWTLSELMKHPRVMEKAQQELKNLVGTDRMVDESDLAKLDYLDMVVNYGLVPNQGFACRGFCKACDVHGIGIYLMYMTFMPSGRL